METTDDSPTITPDPALVQELMRSMGCELSRSDSAGDYCTRCGAFWDFGADVCTAAREHAVNLTPYVEAQVGAGAQALAAVNRVGAVVKGWTESAGPGSEAERVFGGQVVSVEFAATTLRSAIDGDRT